MMIVIMIVSTRPTGESSVYYATVGQSVDQIAQWQLDDSNSYTIRRDDLPEPSELMQHTYFIVFMRVSCL